MNAACLPLQTKGVGYSVHKMVTKHTYASVKEIDPQCVKPTQIHSCSRCHTRYSLHSVHDGNCNLSFQRSYCLPPVSQIEFSLLVPLKLCCCFCFLFSFICTNTYMEIMFHHFASVFCHPPNKLNYISFKVPICESAAGT